MHEFKLPNMSCGHCVATITQALKTLDPQAVLDIDLGSHTLRIESVRPAAELVEALVKAGYPPA